MLITISTFLTRRFMLQKNDLSLLIRSADLSYFLNLQNLVYLHENKTQDWWYNVNLEATYRYFRCLIKVDNKIPSNIFLCRCLSPSPEMMIWFSAKLTLDDETSVLCKLSKKFKIQSLKLRSLYYIGYMTMEWWNYEFRRPVRVEVQEWCRILLQ